MSCLAPSEHYGACISITEMNRKERGISPVIRSNFIVCFSALKRQSSISLSKHELCINEERRDDENDTVKTFIIRHIVAVPQFFFCVKK